MKILIVMGTRPEVIKLAPVIKELERRGVEHDICVVDQHTDLLDQAMDTFEITGNCCIPVERESGNLNELTIAIFQRFPKILDESKPDWLIVQGDTTTAMACAVSAFYHGVKVAHVEAGLRTFDIQNPYPEESNRIIIDAVSSMHFAPTLRDALNITEYNPGVFVTGNTVIDAVEMVRNDFEPENPYDVIVTLHRRENQKRLSEYCNWIKEFSNNYPHEELLVTVHPNPSVKSVIEKGLKGIDNIHLVAPMEYSTFINTIANCGLIITDSGGIQEEATYLQVPTIVLRKTTERSSAGQTIKLVSNRYEFREAIKSWSKWMFADKNVFGDGTAAKQIVEALLNE